MCVGWLTILLQHCLISRESLAYVEAEGLVGLPKRSVPSIEEGLFRLFGLFSLSGLFGLFGLFRLSGHCEERSDEAISCENPLP